jgi:putative transposase
MPSTHTSLHYHLVFSTKERIRFIKSDWREELHRYLGGTIKAMDGTPLNVGGVEDHVHLLVGLKATHTLADVVRELKSSSSKWIHQDLGRKRFGWQDGYGGFTVSRSNLDQVRRYVADQEKHHERRSFQDEYVELLNRHGIEFDEKYLW